MAKTVSKSTKRKSMTPKKMKKPSKGTRMMGKKKSNGMKKRSGAGKSHTKTNVRQQRKVKNHTVQL